MYQAKPRFSFQALQPLNYLKTFNKMIEYNCQLDLNHPTKEHLQLVRFSKYPITKTFEHMQEIFENVRKKKQVQAEKKDKKEIKYDRNDVAFMKSHNDVMRNILGKLIRYNEDKQITLEKRKLFYKQDFGGMRRNASHHSLGDRAQIMSVKYGDIIPKKYNKVNKDRSQTISYQEQQENSRIQKISMKNKIDKEKKAKVLPTTLPTLQSIEKSRNHRQNQQNLIKKKLQQNPQLQNSQNNTVKDEMSVLEDQIKSLQLRQIRKNIDFTNKIENQISEFGRRASMQIKTIQSMNFWNEPQNRDTKRGQSKKKKQRQAKLKPLLGQKMQSTPNLQKNIKT